MRFASLMLVVLAGCWTGAPTPPTPSSPPPLHSVARRPQPADAPSYSQWLGTYLCAQGVTAIRLDVQALPDGAANATFEFGPSPDNPQVIPTGAYKLTGALYVTDTGELELKLVPDRWLEQPTGYAMVGLYARSDRQHRVMRGKIESPTCDWLELTRSR